MSSPEHLDFSIVIATYNRLDGLKRAIRSVLDQQGSLFELIVVNDGSTDVTRSYLDSLEDDRLTVIHRENGGLSAARNTGIERATGTWLTFLDDDDAAAPNWLRIFAGMIDEGAGVVCCGAQYFEPSGEPEFTALPWDLGPEFGGQVANSLAGAFAVRSDLVEEIGGFDERMTCSHQHELWLRLLPVLQERGLEVRHTDEIGVHLEVRAPTDRPLSDPMALTIGTRRLLEKHRETYALHPRSRANLYGVLGVSAARLERWSDARSALLSSAKAEPSNLRRWIRLSGAVVPPLGRRMWQTDDYRHLR
jgi:glycosyltransferase involved in cell wall biosynthesis